MAGIKAIHFSYSIGVGMSGALLIWTEDLAMQMIDLCRAMVGPARLAARPGRRCRRLE